MASKAESSKTPRERAAAFRARKRAAGYRLMQRWVIDTTTVEFAAEARRQSLIVASLPTEAEDIAFIEAAFDWTAD